MAEKPYCICNDKNMMYLTNTTPQTYFMPFIDGLRVIIYIIFTMLIVEDAHASPHFTGTAATTPPPSIRAHYSASTFRSGT